MTKQEALQLTLDEIYKKFDSSENGLSLCEVNQNLQKYGINKLKKADNLVWKVFLHQLQSSFIYLLIAASIISYAISDFSDGTIILVILILDIALGFFQEYKSERTVQKLSKFLSKQVRIKRNNHVSLLDESQIVPGDIIIIKEGDIVPADMRIIKADDLNVDESELTGESLPVNKKAYISKSDEKGLVFTGSIVEKGMAVGIVYATANDTEIGKIAKLSTETKKETQYEKSLRDFSSLLIKIILTGLFLVFVAKIALTGRTSNVTEFLIFIIAVAVGAIPEVLPIIATVSLSIGAMRLAKKHVVVKRLSSLEDMGNINLLCTDKTGTLTENRMVIHNINSTDSKLFQIFMYSAILPLKSKKRRAQNSYDEAFMKYVSSEIIEEAKNYKIINEIPFDAEERRSRVIFENIKNNKYYLVLIGAPDTILEISKKTGEKKYLELIKKDGTEGLHQIAISYKEIKYTENFDILKHENSTEFLGYANLEDPLRPTTLNTLKLAENLGIKIKIITGDSKEVAEYIGRKVELVTDGDIVYTGDELEKMTEKEFKEAILKYNVFARVSPTQKFKIIKGFKENYIVGYQGDGINDAPALKLADVAIAVSSATDIAKENADIILLNKSLEVIINGIRYGRAVFININKYIKYSMINNLGTCMALSFIYLVSVKLPMFPVQLLLSTFITDIPLIMISSDNVEDREVVSPEKHDIKELFLISLGLGVPTAIFEIIYFFMIKTQPDKIVSTSLYLFSNFLAFIVFYAIRSKKRFWKAKQPPLVLNIIFAIALIISISIIYIPKLQEWFYFAPLSFIAISTSLVLMIMYLFLVDYLNTLYFKFFVKEYK
jgi:Mg2+-importing ATPase